MPRRMLLAAQPELDTSVLHAVQRLVARHLPAGTRHRPAPASDPIGRDTWAITTSHKAGTDTHHPPKSQGCH
jgi:hypothetical protein